MCKRSKMYNEGLYNFHSAPSIIKMVKQNRFRGAEYSIRKVNERNTLKISIVKPYVVTLFEREVWLGG
jgi:hypothetical protein